MSKQEKIKYIIRQDGSVTEEVIGVKGAQCLDLTEKIENRLGDIEWRKETDEFYQTTTVEKNVTLQQNQD